MSLTKCFVFSQKSLLCLFCILVSSHSSISIANPTCTVMTTGLSATYDSLSGGDATSVGNIQTSCVYVGLGSATPAYQIQLSTGQSNTYNNRTMRFLGNNLLYNLYTNPSYSLVWGNGTGGTSVVGDSYSMTAGTVVKNYSVYMRIPRAQSANAGSYNDSITVTVMY